MFSPIITPSQTAVMLADGSISRIGATMGTTTTAISMKSRKKPSTKITAMTMMNCIQNPPGSEVRNSLTSSSPPKGAERRGQHGRTQQDDENQRGGLGSVDHHAVQRLVDAEGPPERPDDRDQERRRCPGRQVDPEQVRLGLDVADVQVVDIGDDRDGDQRCDRQHCRIERAAFALAQSVARHDRRAPRQPIAPAWFTVAIPAMIDPSTAKISVSGGTRISTMRPISFRSIFWVNGTDGAQLGLIRPITRMNSMYSPTSTRPRHHCA